ncbi:hypothetical protein [Streptomyces sp. YU58]|uniref:hypothetical protein n=1 Tax=Streptomyces sp. SX92 TaxID=3158972 RepID=UPI0027B8E76B|nr:hypothetical protein [Streptomyces coralus]WLW51244.1 hypothetical protein QU709_07690 [Streptomyces coralus]
MDSGTTVRLKPCTVAPLRGGPRAAVTVAALAPRLRGVADAGRPATVRAPGEPVGAGQTLPAVCAAVLAALQEPVTVRDLAAAPGARQAQEELPARPHERRPVAQAPAPPDARSTPCARPSSPLFKNP